MLLLIGFAIVLLATLGGFMVAGGNPVLLLHVSEFIVIGGIAIGIMVISSPGHVIKNMVGKIKGCIVGGHTGKGEYLDLLKLLYEIFLLGRRSGLIALEGHILEPDKSTIFTKYGSFIKHPERVVFLCNGLRPVVDGKIKPDQLEALLEVELDAKFSEAEEPVHLLQLIGDSLLGVGIVAAVLGIINTMAAIAEGPEKVGEKVAAALTGTFLGVFFAYGFVNPLATRIKHSNANDDKYFRCILQAVSGFAKGLAPLMAVEVARRSLDSTVQPGADELEAILKALPPAK
jgi:chemotaxis protein MotA